MRKRRRSWRPQGGWQCQLLEDRSLLTNFEVTSAFLVDGQGNQMDDAILGELMGVKVRYSTDQIDTSEYRIEFKIDGVVLDSTTTFATGGGGTWTWTRKGWYATAGEHLIEVMVDADNQIAEDDETDNSFSFTVATVKGTPSVKLAWPVEGSIQGENYITNFHDIDPTPGVADFQGGPYAYEKHAAWDISPGHFSDMDEGVDVYAAAPGIVSEINDGEFDRQSDGFNVDPRPSANYVKIDHGDGFDTIYWHLRRDSVEVHVGQVVTTGDRLGLMGSSGVSTGTHLHFSLRRHGRPIEPMMDPDTYLAATIPYSDDVTILRSSGVWANRPTPHLQEGAPRTNVFTDASPTPYVWGNFTAIHDDDLIQTVLRRPDGSIFTTAELNAIGDRRTTLWWLTRNLGPNAMSGTWTVEFLVNGTKLGEDTFQVDADGAPELTVQRGTDLIRHNRYTPVDFGNSPVGGAETEITFTASNTGSAPLAISEVSVPTGFAIVQTLPSSLAVDASADLIVKRVTAASGYAAGEVVIHSDDYDESMYRFSVEGIVEAAEETLVLGIGLRTINEGDRTIANVRRTGATESELTVHLATALHPAQLTFPASIVIPAGSDYASFWLSGSTNSVVEPDEFVQLSATANGFSDAVNNVWVIDDDVGFELLASGGATVVNESGQADTFQIVLTDKPTADVTLSVLSDDTGEVDVVTSTVLFTPENWHLPQAVRVRGVDDSQIDGDQSVDVNVAVTFSNDTRYAALGTQTVAVINQDNDVAGFTIVESGATVASEGEAPDSFSVYLNTAPMSDVIFNIVSADESEIVVAPSTLIFTDLNWATPQEVFVTAVDDDMLDGDRTTTMAVGIVDAASDADFASLADQFVVATSIDNEVASFTVTELDATSVAESSGSDTFTVVLDEAPLSDVVFALTPDIDPQISLDKSTLTFTPSNWDSPQIVTVTGIDDIIANGNRNTTIAISVKDDESNDAFDSLADQFVVVSTIDDDTATFGIEDVTVSESAGTATFSVTLSNPLDIDVMVDVGYSADTATATDFDDVTDTVTFPAGSTTAMAVTVALTDDNLVELTETFAASLALNAATPTGTRMLDVSATATGTITDDDTAIFTIDDVTVNEADETTSFRIALSNPLDTDVKVDVGYVAVTAEISDFDGTTDTATFAKGSTDAQIVTVAISDNNIAELAKTFTASLAVSTSSPVGTRRLDVTDVATGTIADDDTATFTLADLTVNEADGTATFNVMLSNPLDIEVIVDVALSPVRASRDDFDDSTHTITFPAGATASQPVTVAITNDRIVETTETFVASLSINAGTSAGTRMVDVSDTAIATITDDDTATFTIDDVEVNESTGVLEFTVQLDNPLDIPVALDVSYTDGTAADNGTDYDNASDTVTFDAHSTAPQTVEVAIIDDTTSESAETFIASLAIRSGALIRDHAVEVTDTAIGTITDDDVAGTPGDVDGDADFDASDSFLIHLVKLSGTDSQIDQSKGSSALTAAQIRSGINQLGLAADVDGDGDFDASDSFLIHLVKLSGTNAQIDQSKGSSALTAAQIRTNVDSFGGGNGGSNLRQAFRIELEQDDLFANFDWEAQSLVDSDDQTAELVVEAPTADGGFRSWIDAI